VRRRLLGACAVVAVVLGWGCGDSTKQPPPVVEPVEPRLPAPVPDAGTPAPDAGTPDAGTPAPDAGTPDAGTPDSGTPDSGPPTDPGNPPQTGGPGPWPNEPLVNYSQRYGLGNVRSVGVDDAYNIWLLDGERIGVLRPGATQPQWVSNIGQARGGFGYDALALGSTVICGGSAGRAYVGYSAAELSPSFIYGPDGANFPAYDDPDPSRFDPVRYQEYQKGDLDVVKLTPDGSIELEEHLQKSVRNAPQTLGIRNSNDHHFDEDRSVLTCTKVMRGPNRGDIYIGTNHGVTRIKGLVYNSHRHPVWFKNKVDESGNVTGRTQMTGLCHALGIGQNGEVLIGNDWNVGVVMPSQSLVDWDKVDDNLNLEKLNSYVSEVNSQEDMDYWRGFEQTQDGYYYVASRDYGLWQMSILRRSQEQATKVQGLPTDSLLSLAATDDGSLFIGTAGSGLWRLDAQKQLTQVPGVAGRTVKELHYDPTVSPAMLYVLTDAGLTVLRSY
jgi:hypothetical protein